MTYIKYDPPKGWHKGIIQGMEQISDQGIHQKFRCEICKEETLESWPLCEDEGCLTILSMMEEEPNRIKRPAAEDLVVDDSP